MYYFIGFVVVFFALFSLTKKYDLSLFVSLSTLAFITSLHYSIAACSLISFGLLISYFKKVDIKILNFVMITYIFASTIELIAHKYVMHCKNSSLLTKVVQYIPFAKNQYNTTCSLHIQHHLEVEPDMKLNGVKYKNSLFMGWNIFISLFVVFLICGLLSKSLSNYNISFKYLAVISAVITFTWEYIWNKTHSNMHDYSGNYSIKEGPYDDIVDTTFI